MEQWTPESVRYLLARQRERLAQEEQRVLEAASLAGVEFSAAMVAAALETEAIQVEDQCGRLAEQQQFLRLAGISTWPDGTRAARYGFLHALYQEFWHERVNVGQRQQWHLRMGERQEAAYGQRAGEIAAELAVHFAEGGDYYRAVQYRQRAAEQAVQRSAHQEAIGHLTQGLTLLATLPQTPARAQRELRLQLTLSYTLQMAKGAGSTEREQALTRARELCQQVGETSDLFFTLLSLLFIHLFRAEFFEARKFAEQVLPLAQSTQISHLLMYAHWGMGETLLWTGEFGSARVQVEQGIALYETQQYRPEEQPGSINPLVPCFFNVAFALWMQGYPDQALKSMQEALRVARELAQPFSLAVTLNFTAGLHHLRRDVEATREAAEQLITLSTEQGFPDRIAIGKFYRGWALTMQGQEEEGLATMRQGWAEWRAAGAKVTYTSRLASLAEGYGRLGQPEEGLPLLTEALELVNTTGERYYEAELYRLYGELTLQQQSHVECHGSNLEEAEAHFLKAIAIARHQQAKSWELRATMSLTRLWQGQGKQAEAHNMLSSLYNWFTEGFDTKDLQEAKALLEELA